MIASSYALAYRASLLISSNLRRMERGYRWRTTMRRSMALCVSSLFLSRWKCWYSPAASQLSASAVREGEAGEVRQLLSIGAVAHHALSTPEPRQNGWTHAAAGLYTCPVPPHTPAIATDDSRQCSEAGRAHAKNQETREGRHVRFDSQLLSPRTLLPAP